MTDFALDLHRKVQSGYQAFALPSREPRRALAALDAYGRSRKVVVLAWSAPTGLVLRFPRNADEAAEHGLAAEYELAASYLEAGGGPKPAAGRRDARCVGDPVGAVDLAATPDHDAFPSRALLVLMDMHNHFRDSGPLRTRYTVYHAAAAFNCNDGGRPHVRPIVFLHPDQGLHPDVDHLVEPLRLAPLTPAEIRSECLGYLRASLPEGRSGLEGEAGGRLADELAAACTGLLQHQVVDVLSLAARVGDADEVRGLAAAGRLPEGRKPQIGFFPASVRIVREYRRGLIDASGVARVHAGRESFADVGGLDALKSYLGRLLGGPRARGAAKPKGVLLVGVPGCGKSLVAKAAGNEFGRQTLLADLGSLMSSDLGGTERNMRRLLDLIDSVGPSVVFIDEVEKMFAGVESSGRTDGGTIARATGAFMTWSADRGPESDAFVIATANDLASLPPAFYRSGRFNAIFYVGMPGPAARSAMWRMHRARFGLPDQPTPRDADWTGADVANCCEQAHLLGCTLVEASAYVTRTRKTNRAEMDAMETFAEEAGFLDAEAGGEFARGRAKAAPPRAAARARRIAGDDVEMN